jgi:hypothetical protein
MDGKGASYDNVFVKRLWRSVKSEEVCLKACALKALAGTHLLQHNETTSGA